MLYRLAADAVVLFHLLFVVFAVLGGWLALRWRWMPWLHLPAVAWAALVEFNGWICPLTPLENRLRLAGGADAYQGGFIDHYLLPMLYPADLTREVQALLGAVLLAINAAAYLACYVRIRKRRSQLTD